MGNLAAYKRPDVKNKFLTALRDGRSRIEAAGEITAPAKTVDGWIARDDAFREEVEAAEHIGRELLRMRQEEQATTAKRVDKTGADRFRKLREDAARFAPGMLGYLLAVDARVAAIPGNHALSPYFRWSLGEFYAGEYHEFLCVGGRGTGKSTTQIIICCAEMVFRERTIPPMDPRWIWPFMSHNMAESNQRVEPFKRTLQAIGYGEADLVVYSRKDGRSEIQFDDARGQPVKVNIFPNTADACRGGNLCGATDDEEMHWIASKTEGLSKADDVLKVLVGALRADRSRVHIRISSVNDAPNAMLEAAKRGSTSLRYVATLGPFLRDALDGFERVAMHLDVTNRADDAARVRKWAATLTAESPWIPSWVGNPTHDPIEGFELLYDKLRDGQDKVGTWLQENGSCPWPLEFVEGNYFEAKQIDAAVAATRVDCTDRAAPLVAASTREYFAAIDTGAKKNPSALCIVERVKVGGRYQWRPVVLREWRRAKGGLPLDLRMVVLPQMASVLRQYGCSKWWSDGWAGDVVEIVGAQNGITTEFVSTSTATRDVYEPLDVALGQIQCPVVLNGCENIEAAVAQLRQVKRTNDGSAVVPHDGSDHGELGQVLARALAHAGVGQTPPDEEFGWRSFGSERDDGDRYESRHG